MKKILCVGSVTADIMVKPADSIPTPGTLRGVESISMHVGGCAANAAIDLAKLGVPVRLCCRLGQDQFGDFVLQTAREAGVDTSATVQAAEPGTTISVVCIQSGGERSFLYYPGSAGAFCIGDIPKGAADGCDIVFVAGAMILSSFDGEPCAAFLREMRGQGKFTVLDTGWDFEDVWLPKLAEALPFLDLFMPSYEEAVKLSGRTELPEIAGFFRERGVGRIVIKVGKDGAYLEENEGEGTLLPTYPNVPVKDTTGAGDAFCAGFLAGLAQDWDFQSCGAFANAAGTHCVMEIGASAGIKSLEDIQNFMKQNTIL